MHNGTISAMEEPKLNQVELNHQKRGSNMQNNTNNTQKQYKNTQNNRGNP